MCPISSTWMSPWIPSVGALSTWIWPPNYVPIGDGCSPYGPAPASTAGRNSSFRPRLPIHLHSLGQRCEPAGVRPPISLAGDSLDNALCESFFTTLDSKLIDRYTSRRQSQARIALCRFILGWHNPFRRHSANDYMPPFNYERKWNVLLEIPNPNLSAKPA